MKTVAAALCLLAFAAVVHGQEARAVVCDTLATSLKLPNATGTSVQAMTSGDFTPLGMSNVFDTVTALEQWREHGKAPTEIVASLFADGKVVRTRPLCPFPQMATYQGSGSIDQAENVTCRVP